jgi:N-acetylglucosaminyldiphosphoundecaprenol N-acetyl-beta-D-mannosaminyltransferase
MIKNLCAIFPRENFKCALDDCDLEGFIPIAADFGVQKYGYAVTPNIDHLIRLHEDPFFRSLYAQAAFVLLDSRLLAHLIRLLTRQRLPVCAGSDLVAALFDQVIAPDDPILLLGGDHKQANALKNRYGLRRLTHFNPPMGFIRDFHAVERCLRYIETHGPFRFHLLAIGSPQQEIIAQQLGTRRVARGLALCIGSSVNFLTGEEQRAPMWLRRAGMEWLFRLMQNPRRLAWRYLIRGPRIFALVPWTEFILRPSTTRLARDGRMGLLQRGTSRPLASNEYTPSSQPLPKSISA